MGNNMDINITRFYSEACPMDYSASVAEIGADAGLSTWQAAKDDADEWNFLDNDEKREAFRSFVQSSGGWDADEIAAWSEQELNALFIQWIAGDIRECLEWDVPNVWENYREMAEAGQVSSNLYQGDDGQVYFYIGN